MRFQRTFIESFGYVLPEEVVTSDEVERRLAPLYERLRLPEGRLELMTGIRERRLWPPGTLPSEMSVNSAERALAAAGIDRREIGVLVHGSVCRDYLEPATASTVHHRLELAPQCLIYDVSNACLGLMNGVVQVATLIELGHVRAGLVVGSEGSRPLLETTIAALNRDTSLTRQEIKSAMASLTIGSASCAIVVVDEQLTASRRRLVAATARANTQFHDLCRSGRDESVAGGMQPIMNTDAERLMAEGIRTGVETFRQFLDDAGWSRDQLDRTVSHQVGAAHRRAMLDSLGLEASRDYCTFPWLGNTGSVALPVTMALALEEGFVQAGQRIGLLGIGSGINCLMLAVA